MKKATLLLLFLFSLYPAFSQFEIVRDDFVYSNQRANLEMPENVSSIAMTLELFREKFTVGYSDYTGGMQAETRLDIRLDNRQFVRIWSYYSERNDKNYLYVYVPGARFWRFVELPNRDPDFPDFDKDPTLVNVSLDLSEGQGRLRVSMDDYDFAKTYTFRTGRDTQVSKVSPLAYIFLYDMEVMNGSFKDEEFATTVTIDSLADAAGQPVARDITALDRRGNPYEGGFLPLEVLQDAAPEDGDSSGIGHGWNSDRITWGMSICVHDD